MVTAGESGRANYATLLLVYCYAHAYYGYCYHSASTFLPCKEEHQLKGSTGTVSRWEHQRKGGLLELLLVQQ